MSQDNDTIARFKKRVDAQLGKDLIEPELPPRPTLGSTDLKPVYDELDPVELNLELSPEETEQAISQIANRNLLNNLIKNPLEYTPKTKLIVAISSLVTLLVTYLSGCF